MAAESVLEAITRITAQHLGVDAAKVLPSSHFKDLGADSLDLIELVMAFEHEFHVSIPDDELMVISSVEDAVHRIESDI